MTAAPQSTRVKVGLDAMGGDTAPDTTVAGAVRAARELPIDVVLFGQQDVIEGQLSRYPQRPSNLSLVHCAQAIGMDEPPVLSVRRKRDSSINVGIEYLREKRIDAYVSAGNTGAMVCASTLFLGLLPGVERPGIGIVLPGLRGETLLLDAGANVDAKPSHLLQYGLMGEAYMRFVLEKSHPKVGLLSVGEEETKGNEATKQAFGLLEQAGINFVGNVEGRDIFLGECDVIICDGFVGNVALKTAESLAYAISQVLKRALATSAITKLGAWLSRSAFQALRKEIDYAEHGGAPLLGVNGVCVIAHGASSAKAIKNAIRVGYESARHDVNQHLIEAIRLQEQPT